MPNRHGSLTFLGLGSNVGDRLAHLRRALQLLGREGVYVNAVSGVYETGPVGFEEQPLFLNIVVRAHTNATPMDLLRTVKQVERDVGRVPTFRWGPRVVDIDILLLGDLKLASSQLTIPHPELSRRAFALVPLHELEPALVLPSGDAVADVMRLNSVASQHVRRLGGSQLLESSPVDST